MAGASQEPDVLSPEEENQPFSLSDRQLWIWRSIAESAESQMLLLTSVFRGCPDPAILERAFCDLISRHKSLRTTFIQHGGELQQRFVSAPVRAPIEVVTAAGHGLNPRFRRAIQRPFDFSAELPIRIHLQRDEKKSVLAIVIHPLVADAWSASPILRDLANSYKNRTNGSQTLPEPEESYSSLARIQSAHLTAREISFWTKKLAGFSPPKLPFGRKQADSKRLYHSIPIRLDSGLHEGLRRFADRQEVGLTAVLLGASMTLLRPTSSENIVSIATLASGRSSESENCVGVFANPLLIRGDLGTAASFSDFVQQVHAAHSEALAHQGLPYLQVTDLARGGTASNNAPLVPAFLVLRQALDRRFDLAGVRGESGPMAVLKGGFEVLFDLVEGRSSTGLSAGIEGRVEYRADLYEHDEIEALIRRFLAVLRTGLDKPAVSVAELGTSIVPEAASRYSPPRNPLQDQLAQMWEDTLGLEGVGIQDSFPDLDGDRASRQEFLKRVESTFGRDISSQNRWSELSVESLADALLRAADPSPVIEIQPGDGSREPFFFLHGDIGGAGYYAVPLARSMGAEYRVLVVQPHRLLGSPEMDIQKMASDNVARIQKVQPHGPYYLGGHCVGGFIAYEMARLLEQQGEIVRLLLLTDADFIRDKVKGIPAELPDPPEKGASDPFYRAWLLSRYVEIGKKYSPGVYGGKVSLLWSRGFGFNSGDPTEGWKEVAAQVSFARIPGNHISCFGRHVRLAAREFKVHFDQAALHNPANPLPE